MGVFASLVGASLQTLVKVVARFPVGAQFKSRPAEAFEATDRVGAFVSASVITRFAFVSIKAGAVVGKSVAERG